MKKSFYFALALTAGLFASCSSDDLTAEAPQQPDVDLSGSESALISINVDAPNATTRGTGSVKGTTWGGQTFNLFMFNKGTFTPSMYVPSVGAEAVDIYKDTEMTTTEGSTLANQVLTSGDIQYQYFPSTGRYDFWAYRIDDAWVDAADKAGWEDGADATTKVIEGIAAWTAAASTYTWDTETAATEAEQTDAVNKTEVEGWAPGASTEGEANTWYKYKDGEETKYAKCTAVTTGTGGYTASDATQVTVPFKIDGSQDLMVADTKTAEAAAALAEYPGVNAEDAASYIYSAYAARRGVNPAMTFKHQLVRLQFQVKAATRDVSEAATPKLTVGTENTAGAKYYAGFKVNKVEVWSKNKGKLIVAYKGTAPESRITWDEGQAWVARDAEDAWLESTTLTPFELKSRVKTLDEKAQVGFVQRAKTATTLEVPATYAFVSGEEAKTVADAGTKTITDVTQVYDSNATDPETGMPTGNKTTVKAIKEDATKEYYYYLYVRSGNHEGTETPYSEPSYVDDPSKPLVDLEAVTPKWDGYTEATSGTPTWEELTETVTGYEWTVLASPTDAQKTAATEVTTVPVSGTAGTGGTGTEGTEGKIVKYDNYGADVYYICDVIYNTDGYTPADAIPTTATASDIGKVIKVSDKYYRCNDVGGTAAVEGEAKATPIGESMLVAPADENGYLVRFSYTRCKMITASDFVDIPGEAIINVKTKAGSSFTASKFYTVTAILYSDGEMKFEQGDIEEQTDGSDELDDNGDGYGAES